MKYHTKSFEDDNNAIGYGILKATEIAKNSGLNVIYLCPTFQSFGGDTLDKLFGKNTGDFFIKSREMFVDDVRFLLETQRTKQTNDNAVILAVYLNSKQLNAALANYRTTDLVYVPWSNVERNLYIANHSNSTSI